MVKVVKIKQKSYTDQTVSMWPSFIELFYNYVLRLSRRKWWLLSLQPLQRVLWENAELVFSRVMSIDVSGVRFSPALQTMMMLNPREGRRYAKRVCKYKNVCGTTSNSFRRNGVSYFMFGQSLSFVCCDRGSQTTFSQV